MQILLVSPRTVELGDFMAGLTEAGAKVVTTGTATTALTLAQKQSPKLVIVDSNLTDSTPFKLITNLMGVNAMINTAVITPLTPDEFHEAGEGLGILTSLPPHPSRADAATLMTTLADLRQ